MIHSETFWGLVDARADATPDALFGLDEAGRTLTFAALRAGAERTAAALVESGVRAGDVVSWVLPTRLEAAVLMAALARVGAVRTGGRGNQRLHRQGHALASAPGDPHRQLHHCHRTAGT